MACDGNRNAHFAAVAGGGSAVAQAFGGAADAQQALDTLFELGRNGPKPDAAAPLAQAQTRLMFAQMQRRGLKPPTHSTSGLPKADAQFGYALVQQTLGALDRGEPLPPQARDLLLSSGRTRQIANVRAEATGRIRCGSCGQFASPLRGHTCPRTASVDTLRRSLVRRLKVPPSAYPDAQLTALLDAARSNPVTMRHNATGEEVTVTLDALPLALANGFVPKLWAEQGRRAMTIGGAVVTVFDDRNMGAVPEPRMQNQLIARRDEITQRLRTTHDPDELTRLNSYRNDLDGAIRENVALGEAAADHGLVLTPDLLVIDPVVIDFETYAAMRGASRQSIGDAGLHSPAAHVSGAARRRHLALQSERDDALMARRDELRVEYERKVTDGELRPLTNVERLTEHAAGDPESEGTQAAQRVLAKRAVRATLTPTMPTIGRTAQAYGCDPTRAYELRYRVVDLDDLIPSNLDSGGVNPAYDMALQPRQRDRAASQAQIAKVAQTLTPEALLTDFQQLDKGTPIIGSEDTCVESGNGRVLALRKARESFPERWQAYQSQLQVKAATFGIDPATIQGMRAPVLVRERVDTLDRAAFAREANAPPVLQMSTLENAVVDARRMSDDLLLRLNMREDQSIDLALRARGNAGFVRDFMQTLPENERATLMRGDGSLNQQGIWRIKAALFTRTFPGEAGRRLAETFTESLDSTTKNFEQAVAGTLPQLIRAQSRLSSGQRKADLDLSGDMAASLDMLARLREQELPVPVYLEQSTLFERELTPTQEKMLRHFDSIGRSSKAIRAFLSTYAQAIEEAPDPNQNDMFGGGGVTREQLLNRLINT